MFDVLVGVSAVLLNRTCKETADDIGKRCYCFRHLHQKSWCSPLRFQSGFETTPCCFQVDLTSDPFAYLDPILSI